ncbi:MAG TPA: DUF2917 domain-containing protein [Burkholderiales bacterium]|nr:DUF2917 domain-containing protein [Burkholderiales bacterium]
MRIELQRGELLRLSSSAGNTIRAHGGAVWITEEDRREDVVLEDGHSHTFVRPGLALVEAFEDASVSFEVIT